MSSKAGQEFLANWMKENEASLPTKQGYNFATSGRKPNGWKRRAIGTLNGQRFRVFERDGVQDVKRKDGEPPLTETVLPQEYAVVWYDEPMPVRIEWMALDQVLRLGCKLDSSIGYFN